MPLFAELTGFAVALAIGLLIGTERERRKGAGRDRAAAGLRTFALIALTGSVAERLGGVGIAVAGAFVALAALAAYRRSRMRDPGLTTEVAMLMTFLLGVLAMRETALAAGLGVAVAVLLAAKSRLHRLVRHALSERELHDALLLAAAAAIVLPMLPDRAIDPWQVINPRQLWTLAVIVMAINAGGHIALRTLGPRRGLLLAGLAGGFVSSTATIASLGSRARAQPALASACAGAALLSNLSSVVQLAVIVGALAPALLQRLAWPLAAAAAAVAAASLLAWPRARRELTPEDDAAITGRAFEPQHALLFVAVVATVMLASAAALRWFGDAAVGWMLALSGLADVHAAAASAAQLSALGRIEPAAAGAGVLAAIAANSGSKLVVAFATGGGRYGLRLLPGVLSMLAAFALVLWWQSLP